MVKDYTIYGLRVIGTNTFFYIGVTCASLIIRLRGHVNGVKSGDATNFKKFKVIKEAGFSIEIVLIKKIVATKKDAFIEENKTVFEYLEKGHPLVNINIPHKLLEGEVCGHQYILRTTKSIFAFYKKMAVEKGTSVNAIMNIALLKYKKQLSKPKK